MIQVYIADTDALSHPETFRHYMDRIDETRREKSGSAERKKIERSLLQISDSGRNEERCVKESGGWRIQHRFLCLMHTERMENHIFLTIHRLSSVCLIQKTMLLRHLM